MTESYIQILKNARTILLVDWPGVDVPLSLLKAGFMVIGYAPDNYSIATIEINSDGKEKLIFKALNKPPASVDIVNIFRPEEEHEEIISRHVLPLKAKVIWLQPPVKSAHTVILARENGLIFIEGEDLAALAKML
ncbi:CoA-binding protein [Mucilaginibacter sp. OK098]|uniref:CoA-binding protein n=1 Tax=Mucilaginibacter sp. OK098 TaxID=1855297 RepID=UPI00091538B1|nr:CoA-binding protein [Mucilaginibacter sp. OK098]SHM12120.1 Predicted CoA-binding protein [Mucilaginibacter sp. OK098]